VSLDETISARTTRFVESTLTADTTAVQARLTGQKVAVTLDPAVGTTFAGQMILFTLLNLLVRLELYAPQLEVTLPDVERHSLLRLLDSGSLPRALERFFSPFPAARRLRISSTPADGTAPTLHLVVSPQPMADALSVWADGWVTYVNCPAPFRAEDANSVGACVAADFAAAEVFKRLITGLPLRPGLKLLPIDRLVFSAYNYRLSSGPNPPLPAAVNVDGVVVVGLGGIGAGFVTAASALPGLAGLLTLVDKDPLDPTNLNRLLYARPGDTGFKAQLSRRTLGFHAEVDARIEWFDEFTVACGSHHDLVVVGVDKDPVRRAIQHSMPQLIFNGGTSDTASFQLTRHDYLHGACLACIAAEELDDYPVERELARQLGLDLDTVLRYLKSGEPLPTTLLRERGVLTGGDIERLGDRPLAEIQARICAQVPLGSGKQQEAVSISFLSALPGFLLLGEVIKERSYPGTPRAPLNETANHLLLSLLGRPCQALLGDWWQKARGCDCIRPAYQRNYQRKWGKA
jgi:molybdopterin/thiamine biosynthesis adenylyltransferase